MSPIRAGKMDMHENAVKIGLKFNATLHAGFRDLSSPEDTNKNVANRKHETKVKSWFKFHKKGLACFHHGGRVL